MSCEVDRVVLFGGGGFVGSHLSERLLGSGYRVRVVDIDDRKIDHLRGRDGFGYTDLDVQSDGAGERIAALVRGADAVFNLVALARPQSYVERPLEVVQLNFLDNLPIVREVQLNFLDNLPIVRACARTGTRLIHFSTSEVYGKNGHGATADESDLVVGPVERQRWIYSSAKQLLDRTIHACGRQRGLDYAVLRPFNLVGPRMDALVESPAEPTPRLLTSFLSALINDFPMYLVDGGESRRAFTHVDDGVSAALLVLENPGGRFDREIVNVGAPGNETTVAAFADLVREVYRSRTGDRDLPPVETVPGEEFYGDGYEDVRRRTPDVSKLEAAGWAPEVGLREAVERTVDYYLERHPSSPVTPR